MYCFSATYFHIVPSVQFSSHDRLQKGHNSFSQNILNAGDERIRASKMDGIQCKRREKERNYRPPWLEPIQWTAQIKRPLSMEGIERTCVVHAKINGWRQVPTSTSRSSPSVRTIGYLYAHSTERASDLWNEATYFWNACRPKCNVNSVRQFARDHIPDSPSSSPSSGRSHSTTPSVSKIRKIRYALPRHHAITASSDFDPVTRSEDRITSTNSKKPLHIGQGRRDSQNVDRHRNAEHPCREQ
ncbi:hypothetical protein C8R44DRAFT_932591 [Mycena epipterygia]|nr:hypothetical protein C8R44DRAFT_932591 [Mycena epipterygia]